MPPVIPNNAKDHSGGRPNERLFRPLIITTADPLLINHVALLLLEGFIVSNNKG
jgi:hypothetical protein